MQHRLRSTIDVNRSAFGSEGYKAMAEPLILAVESSGRMGAVAIATGSRILSERYFSAPMRHSMEVFQATEDLLRAIGRKANEIGHIYISAGPGSFTGLRIATTMAKIMSLAGGVKIAAVDTLDVIAANCSEYKTNDGTAPAKTASILDAKRGEFFTAVYQRAANQMDSNSPGKDDSARTAVFNWKKIVPDCDDGGSLCREVWKKQTAALAVRRRSRLLQG